MKLLRLLLEGVRSLAAGKTKTFLMALGTTIGIAALTVILCISAGTHQKVKSQVARFGARAVMILPGHGSMSRAVGGSAAKAELTLIDSQAIADQIEGIEGISSMAAIFGMSIKYGNSQTKCHVDGVDADWHWVWDWPVASGQPITQSDIDRLSRVCVLGTTVHRELFGGANPIGEEILIGSFRFKVIGVLESRGITGSAHDRDNRILVPITTAMRRIANIKKLTSIRVKVVEGYDLDQTADAILHLLNERHQIDSAIEQFFTVMTTNALVRRFKGVADTVTHLLIALTALSLLVGGLVLMNIMLVSVSERRSEIGLRRAIGAGRKDIFTQFLAEAVGVNIMGLFMGWALGAAAAVTLKYSTDIPVAFSVWIFLLGGPFSFIVGIVFGVLPARRAADLSPVEALR